MSSAHDRWLANYHSSVETAYCQDYDCPGSDGVTVDYEEEYGQGSIRPEECPDCRGPLGWDCPTEPEEVAESPEGLPAHAMPYPASTRRAVPSPAEPGPASPQSYTDEEEE
jgi:hypothetical protein